MDSPAPDRYGDCAEVVRALWEYLDGRMSKEAVRDLDAHLARCEGCRSHFEFEARLTQALTALRRPHTDPARLRHEVLAVLRRAGFYPSALPPTGNPHQPDPTGGAEAADRPRPDARR